MTELEKAAKLHIWNHPNNGMSYPEWDGADAYDAFVAGAEWQAKQSPWISVDERLPEDGLIDPIAWHVTYKVIILTSNGKSSISQRKWNCNLSIWEWKGSGSFKDSVVKWMPIPE